MRESLSDMNFSEKRKRLFVFIDDLKSEINNINSN